MFEYLAVLGGIAFIVQYVFVLGKLVGRLDSLDENVKWIRNYILVKPADDRYFQECSPVTFKEDILTKEWKETLNELKIKEKKHMLDYVVDIMGHFGPLKLKQAAREHAVDLDTFLLACSVYLFNRFNERIKS